MDLRVYYQNLRATEADMPAPYVVLVSVSTPDGGKPGVITEVPTPIGARMVVEGSARRATEAEIASYRARQAEEKRAAEAALAASKVQFTIVSNPEGLIKPEGSKKQ